jgi:hypothetical protein
MTDEEAEAIFGSEPLPVEEYRAEIQQALWHDRDDEARRLVLAALWQVVQGAGDLRGWALISLNKPVDKRLALAQGLLFSAFELLIKDPKPWPLPPSPGEVKHGMTPEQG